jgi:hypothetical protein
MAEPAKASDEQRELPDSLFVLPLEEHMSPTPVFLNGRCIESQRALHHLGNAAGVGIALNFQELLRQCLRNLNVKPIAGLEVLRSTTPAMHGASDVIGFPNSPVSFGLHHLDLPFPIAGALSTKPSESRLPAQGLVVTAMWQQMGGKIHKKWKSPNENNSRLPKPSGA